MILNRQILFIILAVSIFPLILGTSYAVTELSIPRDAPSQDNYVLFEDHNGVDQFWVDNDGFVFANGSLITGGGGTMEQLTNVTNFGCADGQTLQVNSSGIWACVTPSAGGGGFSTVYKTEDEAIQSDTTLADDDDLHFSVDADSIYALYGTLIVSSHASADFKMALSVPTGTTATGIDKDDALRPMANSNTVTADLTSSQDGSASGTIIPNPFVIVAIIKTSSTSGSVTFQWAQVTSVALDTTLFEGSFFMYKKLN